AALRVFLAVVREGGFSRAAKGLYRSQPAVSAAVSRLEEQLGEKLIDRSKRELLLTDAGRVVLDIARRVEHLEAGLGTALAELRDKTAGRLTIGANESTALYLMQHIEEYRRRYPSIAVQVRRSLSSEVPGQLLRGELELGVISWDPGDDRLHERVLYEDRLAFVVSPEHRLASRRTVGLAELGMETFIAHYVSSPYREIVLRAFREHRVNLNADVEMPTVETIRLLVERNQGVAFLPAMCVEPHVQAGSLREIEVPELQVERKIRLLFPKKRILSYAAQAFLDLVENPTAPAAGRSKTRSAKR
ncbi:MAG: LysR family transcriptional regulator, partial [Acidobacteriota bacterium]